MTSTERKLDEARYFLEQLNPNDPYFDYILSAYLNAARSTPWIMRHEYCKVNGWEKWFKECEISEEEKILLKKINELRVTSTKKTGIKTDYYVLDHLILDEEYYHDYKDMLNTFENGEEIKIAVSDGIENIDKDLSEDSHKFKAKLKWTKEESDLSRESIFKLCNDYYSFLKKQITECVSKYHLNS